MEPPRKKQKLDHKTEEVGDLLLLPVVHPDHFNPITLKPVYVAKILVNKYISVALKIAEKYVNIDNGHLRTVRKYKNGEKEETWILLFNEEGSETILPEVLKLFEEKIPDTNESGEKMIEHFVYNVPARTPLNAKQHEECSHIWPIKLSPSTGLENPYDISYFSKQQLDQLFEHMTYTIELAKKAKENGSAPIAAVIIDPITLEIVGKGVDTSHNGIPVSHAVMNCIEDYSKSEHIKDGYICTDLWLLTTREPCPMCAMAAIHSRFGCVIYGQPNVECGALGSRYSLHLINQLNHRYRVFKHLQLKNCQDLWEKL